MTRAHSGQCLGDTLTYGNQTPDGFLRDNGRTCGQGGTEIPERVRCLDGMGEDAKEKMLPCRDHARVSWGFKERILLRKTSHCRKFTDGKKNSHQL